MTNINWRSKIAITIDNINKDLTDTGLNEAPLTLNSVQSYNPQVTTNADVNDSITSERIGYLIRPGRITIAVTVLAAKPVTAIEGDALSDSEKLQILQFIRAQFNLVITHSSGDNDFGNAWTWTECMVTDSNPSQLTIDGRPTATFNISAVGVTQENLDKGGF